jgi:hypothetical protein
VHIGKTKSNAPFILTKRAATKSEALFKTTFFDPTGPQNRLETDLIGTEGSKPSLRQSVRHTRAVTKPHKKAFTGVSGIRFSHETGNFVGRHTRIILARKLAFW